VRAARSETTTGRSRRPASPAVASVGPAPGSVARGAAVDAARNEVLLVGRVSATAEERELPSGDVLAVWRLVVDRPPPRRPAPPGVRLPTSDTLVCVAWSARLRRTAAGFSPGDVVEVSGSLRQRYWRAGSSLAGRTEVEVSSLRRLSRAAR
jgi:single-strand DNA-binding protein